LYAFKRNVVIILSRLALMHGYATPDTWAVY